MKKRGFALVTVILIVLIMMVLLFGAMSMTSQTILFIGNFKHRTAALYAAEAGLACAIDQVERTSSLTQLTGDMANSPGEYTVDMQCNSTSGKYTFHSTGKVGMFQRKIEVEAEKEAGSYNSVSCDGKIDLDGNVFINAISSVMYPRLETGNVHTNFGGSPAVETGEDFTLDITGIISARGTISSQIPDEHKKEGVEQTFGTMTKEELLQDENGNPVSFPGETIDSSGIVTQNTHIVGDLTINGLLELQEGSVLYVEGDLTINGGIVGSGTVVVAQVEDPENPGTYIKGNSTVKGSMELKTDNTDGIVFYSEGDVTVAHPMIVTDPGYNDEVSGFFAEMPEFAPLYITHSLPENAPEGTEFFEWYANNQNSQDAEFQLWLNGDGTAANPGLSPEVKEWLNNLVGNQGLVDAIGNHTN
ncbi:MAG: pilus assembly PilX N-terminal domain-containing protein [Candidatus Eremiobacteraeota bacterium]|nr:pilus assembly PilX N-terminal domain-containing protein [Candidatus Eremiobacteraeota bacterium]